MKPQIHILGLVCLLASALAAPGSALHCNGNIITIHAGGETLYIDDRGDETGDVSLWIYQETNGEPGLQSGHGPFDGHDNPVLSFTDPCQHVDPDGLIII